MAIADLLKERTITLAQHCLELAKQRIESVTHGGGAADREKSDRAIPIGGDAAGSKALHTDTPHITLSLLKRSSPGIEE